MYVFTRTKVYPSGLKWTQVILSEDKLIKKKTQVNASEPK